MHGLAQQARPLAPVWRVLFPHDSWLSLARIPCDGHRLPWLAAGVLQLLPAAGPRPLDAPMQRAEMRLATLEMNLVPSQARRQRSSKVVQVLLSSPVPARTPIPTPARLYKASVFQLDRAIFSSHSFLLPHTAARVPTLLHPAAQLHTLLNCSNLLSILLLTSSPYARRGSPLAVFACHGLTPTPFASLARRAFPRLHSSLKQS